MSYYYSKKRERPSQQHASAQRAGHHHHNVQRLERLQVGIDEMEKGNYEDIDGNGDVWPPPMPARVYRYDTTLPQGGNIRYEFHPDQVQSIPRRRSATTQGQPVQGQRVQQERPRPTYANDEEEELRTNRPVYHRRVHTHWFVFAGIGAIIALTIWIGAAWINVWWTGVQNDWTYTAQFRTFSIDRAVGHNGDSTERPSHFIVQNDKRHILIFELPADDWSKAIIYSAPLLIGDGQEKTPVTISFQANMQTGRVDMVLHVQDQTYIFTNNGQKFVVPQGQ